MELTSITLAAGLATGVALAGVAARALTPAAALAAIVVGTAIGAGTGWPGLLALPSSVRIYQRPPYASCDRRESWRG